MRRDYVAACIESLILRVSSKRQFWRVDSRDSTLAHAIEKQKACNEKKKAWKEKPFGLADVLRSQMLYPAELRTRTLESVV